MSTQNNAAVYEFESKLADVAGKSDSASEALLSQPKSSLVLGKQLVLREKVGGWPADAAASACVVAVDAVGC